MAPQRSGIRNSTRSSINIFPGRIQRSVSCVGLPARYVSKTRVDSSNEWLHGPWESLSCSLGMARPHIPPCRNRRHTCNHTRWQFVCSFCAVRLRSHLDIYNHQALEQLFLSLNINFKQLVHHSLHLINFTNILIPFIHTHTLSIRVLFTSSHSRLHLTSQHVSLQLLQIIETKASRGRSRDKEIPQEVRIIMASILVPFRTTLGNHTRPVSPAHQHESRATNFL